MSTIICFMILACCRKLLKSTAKGGKYCCSETQIRNLNIWKRRKNIPLAEIEQRQRRSGRRTGDKHGGIRIQRHFPSPALKGRAKNEVRIKLDFCDFRFFFISCQLSKTSA